MVEGDMHTARLLSVTAAATMFVVPLLGCGSDSEHRNQPRPAAPIVVAASIGPERVSLSPSRFGAGPITLVVTNQTDRSQQITLETDEGPGTTKTGIRQDTGPINPRDTASLKADVREGRYRVRVSGEGIRAARIQVAGKRKSAQNELLLP